ncbi:hypothetical protein [Hymenobacter terrenus]|uniref:hypothetical protein n=1 Tax=Hymenobacter terrenus TaxID=1629124 RepID=UPI0006193282|nr:hypothetical protein [Hymenobacter terrenus]
MLTTATRPGPTLTYAGRTARYHPGHRCYELELPSHELRLYPDSTGALTEADIVPVPPKYRPDKAGVIHIDSSRPRDTLTVSLRELQGAFGPWQGDFPLPPAKEGPFPPPHSTEFSYQDPNTGKEIRLTAWLRNAPSAARNRVLSLTITRN